MSSFAAATPSGRAAAPGHADPSTRRRLRIAFVVHDYNRLLGHSRYVVELAERFANDHEVHVFANRFEELPPNIVAHRVPALRTTALVSIFSFAVSASLMVGRGFNIVHAQGFTLLSPDIVTAHISNARWLEGRRLLEGQGLSWQERLFAALVIPAERRSLRDKRATVIAVSSRLRDDIVRLYGRTAETIVIPHGVDHRQFNPGARREFGAAARRELRIAGDSTVFLYVGDFRKGFAPAIRALVSVPRGHLVGVSRTNPTPYQALAADCGVKGRVTVRSATATIERYYGCADALVMPTPYDAFGMVITEALACGVPVITTPLAGASELMKDGIHGVLVNSPNDVETLAAAMNALIQPETRQRMSAAAATLMLDHGWDAVADKTLAVYYAHLLQRGNSAGH